MRSAITPDFWRNKRVFVTGHTGFKGSWLCLWLVKMGASVKGYALSAPTSPALYDVSRLDDAIDSVIADIREPRILARNMAEFDPHIVIHMAAQPLVRPSYEEPASTYETNVMGTLHVFEAARKCSSIRAIVNITTDKCYENREWEWGYREVEPMGGSDPYSSSKGCSELLTAAYRASFFRNAGISVATARAGNVIGGGDWAKDRLVPDALRAFANGRSLMVRNPNSTRPWQHVLEPIAGYLVLAQRLFEKGDAFAEAWNFGPTEEDARSVDWVLSRIKHGWGCSASWQIDDQLHPHEARLLKLDISKARARLGWHPTWTLDEAIIRIVAWHKAWLKGCDMKEYCLAEISDYATAMMESPY